MDGNISIPEGVSPSMIAVGVDGSVTAVVAGDVQNLGQIPLYRFRNPAGLSNEGGNLYASTLASGDPTTGIPGQNGTGTL